MAREKYGITCFAEAKAYADHPVLGQRLEQLAGLIMEQPNTDPVRIFGSTDAVKTMSCMTLFDLVKPRSVYADVLKRLYEGKRCETTLAYVQPLRLQFWAGSAFDLLQPPVKRGERLLAPGAIAESSPCEHVVLAHGLLTPDNLAEMLAAAKTEVAPGGTLSVCVMKKCSLDKELREECFMLGKNDGWLRAALAQFDLRLEGELGSISSKAKLSEKAVSLAHAVWGETNGGHNEKATAEWRVAHCKLE